MLLQILRDGLERAIAFVDQSTRAKPMLRPADAQHEIDAAVQTMALYQYFSCPFCIKTRRAIHRLNLPIELRDAQHDPEHRSTLLAGGGRVQVPCLRIDEGNVTQWLYESSDIIAYLDGRFGGGAPPGPIEPLSVQGSSSGQPPSERAASEQTQTWINNGVPPQIRAGLLSARSGSLCSLAAVGLLAGATSQADPPAPRTYECANNGVKAFSDKPCGHEGRSVSLGYSSPQTSVDDDLPAAESADGSKKTNAFLDRLKIKRAIARAEGRISDLQKDRDNEITRLRGRVKDNAVAPHRRSASVVPRQVDSPRVMAAQTGINEKLMEQMQVVSTRYADDIAIAEQHLEHLRAQLERMDGASGQP